MVQARTRVAEQWLKQFGPLLRLSSLVDITHNVVGLHTWLSAPEFLLIDAETHVKDDSSGAKRWCQGDTYDVALARIQMSTGSLLQVLVHVRKPTGVLDADTCSPALICRFARGGMGRSGASSTGRAAA